MFNFFFATFSECPYVLGISFEEIIIPFAKLFISLPAASRKEARNRFLSQDVNKSRQSNAAPK